MRDTVTPIRRHCPRTNLYTRMIEVRMAPMATRHAEGEELTDDRPAAPASVASSRDCSGVGGGRVVGGLGRCAQYR